jgi:hypothetical protein
LCALTAAGERDGGSNPCYSFTHTTRDTACYTLSRGNEEEQSGFLNLNDETGVDADADEEDDGWMDERQVKETTRMST